MGSRAVAADDDDPAGREWLTKAVISYFVLFARSRFSLSTRQISSVKRVGNSIGRYGLTNISSQNFGRIPSPTRAARSFESCPCWSWAAPPRPRPHVGS